MDLYLVFRNIKCEMTLFKAVSRKIGAVRVFSFCHCLLILTDWSEKKELNLNN